MFKRNRASAIISPGWVKHGHTYPGRSQRGFTIIEVLTVVVIIGILSAIAAPGWLRFVSGQRLKAAGNRALLAAREAQSKSKQQNRGWEVSFQESGGTWQYAVYPAGATGAPRWTELLEENGSEVAIDTANSTLNIGCTHGSYCITFEDRGILADAYQELGSGDGSIGRISFQRSGSGSDDTQRQCVVATSLLGSLQLNRNDNCF